MIPNNHAAQIFPLIQPLPEVLGAPRILADVMDQIRGDQVLCTMFESLAPPEQEAFLGFCMGNRGLKVTYDPFFQHLFHPGMHPERLNRLLTCIMGQNVKVREVLSRERMRLSEGSSLLIMDILVQLADGSLVSVEMQKVGYDFPVERSFCYGSDLLVRQYDLVRKKWGKKFSYRDMRPVYIIILMEKSPGLFRRQGDPKPSDEKLPDGRMSVNEEQVACRKSENGEQVDSRKSVKGKQSGSIPLQYIHRSEFSFDTGVQVKSLENFIYISLDIFREIPHNELTELEAWLYFLASDEPADILRIVRKYPFFREMYQDIVNFRYQPKELITMYSEALRVMDKNTVDYMIEELQNEIRQQREESSRQLRQQKEESSRQLQQQREESSRQLQQQKEENERLRAVLAQYEPEKARDK